jgi:hypothetical protein
MIHPFVLVPLSLELVIFASYVHDDHLFGKHSSMKHILLLTFLGCYITKEKFETFLVCYQFKNMLLHFVCFHMEL